MKRILLAILALSVLAGCASTGRSQAGVKNIEVGGSTQIRGSYYHQ